MRTIQGPAIFLAQFLGEQPPHNNLESLAQWAGSLGYIGVQMPTFDRRIFDLEQAAESETYGDEITSMLASHGLVITELSLHRQGHLVALHPAYETIADVFTPPPSYVATRSNARPGQSSSSCLAPKPRSGSASAAS